MNTKDVAKHFGGRIEARAELGVSRQLWLIWEQRGIPYGRQLEIQIMTGEDLIAVRPRKKKAIK